MIQELIATIHADAETQAAYIQQAAEAEVARIREETARLVAARKSALAKAAKQQEQELLQRMEGRRQLAAAQAVLAKKQELLASVFADAGKKLEQVKGPARKKVILALLAKAHKQVDIAHIIAAPQDEKYMKKRSVKTSTMPGIGGFVAVNRQGTVRIDYRFETIIEQVKQAKSAEIAMILFPR